MKLSDLMKIVRGHNREQADTANLLPVDKDEPYFPNKSADTLAYEAGFRRHVSGLGDESKIYLYECLTALHPDLETTRFRREDDIVVVSQCGRDIAFPFPIPTIKYSHISFGYEEWLRRKYSLPGFLQVDPGDIVVDCGAYVGGFSLNAAKKASRLHAFEPAPHNFRCLEANFRDVEFVICNQEGLYHESRVLDLNIAASSVEHSFLEPDDGVTVRTESVKVIRLEDYCGEQGIETIDFLKIEAEGVEIEVFEGLGGVRARKIAVDVSPERNNESPLGYFESVLGAMGYDLRVRGHVLFARL